jgi:hypothetical protein
MACQRWHRAGDGCGRWWRRCFGEEEGAGPAVQLRGEVEKVVGRLVWTMWGRSGASTRR